MNVQLYEQKCQKVPKAAPSFKQPSLQPRQKIPKDGPGTKGVPECYYTSRVLNSTNRYVKFVKKLRAEEEEHRKGAENQLKEEKDSQTSDFFIRCDRRSLIKDVARRVDLCMASYEDDLNAKRRRLTALFEAEEEENIKKFVIQAQAGAEALWHDKKDRLAYLLAKRKKEHEDKYKEMPLSKCVQALPHIYKLRDIEAQGIQLYQMREKQARKMADTELDKMWQHVAMRESEALKARMEHDAIERARRDHECKLYTDMQLEQRRIQREKEKEMLKQEALRFKSIWESDILKEEEAERQRAVKSQEHARDQEAIRKQRRETRDRLEEEIKLVNDTWDSVAKIHYGEDQAKIQLARKKERELDECNRRLIAQKKEIASLGSKDDHFFEEEALRLQLKSDLQRCEFKSWQDKTNRDVRSAMLQQIEDRKKERETRKAQTVVLNAHERQSRAQLDSLLANKQLEEARARTLYQNDLKQQIEYSKLLKERARQEELDQIRKCQLATEEYEKEMAKMLNRPFFSEEVHPFMKQMATGLKMGEKCPCSKPDYCK